MRILLCAICFADDASCQVEQSSHAPASFNAHDTTYHGAAAGGDLEALLFKRLEGVRKRPDMAFKPGALLMAAYGDNWCADSLQRSSPEALRSAWEGRFHSGTGSTTWINGASVLS